MINKIFYGFRQKYPRANKVYVWNSHIGILLVQSSFKPIRWKIMNFDFDGNASFSLQASR